MLLERMENMSVKVVTVGVRGYAANYARALLEELHSGKFTYSGVIARDITKSEFCEVIQSERIPVYKSLKDYFDDGNQADLVVISTPTHLHKEDTLLAIKHGADVLCEKPIASLYTDAVEMMNASEKSAKFVGIGYQWSFSNANRAFKQDVMAGKLGKAIEMKTLVSWPRGWDYYDSAWKGKIKDNSGNYVLDSVVANATAHYLHNMYDVLGEQADSSDMPEVIRCELLRANNIENFDTCFLDITTRKGTKLIFIASHAPDSDIEDGPKFVFNFEKAVVTFNMDGEANHIIATFNDGTVKDYGNPFETVHHRLWDAIDSVTTREPLVCSVKTAIAHTLTINSLNDYGEIVDFPAELVVHDEEKQKTSVKGLYELMYQAFEKSCLLTDLGIEWSKATQYVVTE